MQRPFYRDLATTEGVAFNNAMSEMRVAVKHSYKDLNQFWTSHIWKREKLQ